MPHFGNLDIGQISTAYLLGDAAKLATADAAFTAGHLPQYGSDGRLTDSGITATASPQGAVGVVIDGGGLVPATGNKGYIQVPYNCTITGWTILADVSGSGQFTVKKSTYAGFPATASIVASAHPLASAAQKATSTTLTGWTTAITAGDVLEFDLDSVTSWTRVILELQVTKI